MKKLAKILLLATIATLGLASLIATSPPPPQVSPIEIITRNPVNQKRGYFEKQNILDPSYACKGDKIDINWHFEDNGTGLLTAEPLENLVPEIKQETLNNNGLMQLTFVDELTLVIEFEQHGSKRKLRQTIKVIPDNLCTKFPIIPIAAYEGKLTQSQPTLSSKDKVLKIYINPYEGSNNDIGALRLDLLDPEEDGKPYPFLDVTLNCITQEAYAKISCKQRTDYYDRIKDLEMDIKVSKDGLSGNYKGLARYRLGSWFDISGTINFSPKP